MQAFCDLWTARGRAVTDTPWQEYPRPALRRDSYLNLNGLWDFAAAAEPPTSFDRTIRVPFPPESLLSGIHEVFPEETPLWYRRSFRLPEGFVRGRVLLHFGAVDQIAGQRHGDWPPHGRLFSLHPRHHGLPAGRKHPARARGGSSFQ